MAKAFSTSHKKVLMALLLAASSIIMLIFLATGAISIVLVDVLLIAAGTVITIIFFSFRPLLSTIEQNFAKIVLLGTPLLVAMIVGLSSTYYLYKYYVISLPELTFSQTALRVAAITYNTPRILWNSLLVTLDNEQPPVETQMPTFHLRVEPGSLETMAENLPYSAKEKYYNAWLTFPDGNEKRISYRYRGRSKWHWTPEKPSLRLRLPKEKPLNLGRHINLVNPEDPLMVSNYLGDELARRANLLSLDTKFARLFINNQYYGVYHTTSREDESLLRRQKRMPGPLYIGDNIQDPWSPDGFKITGDNKHSEELNPLDLLTQAIYLPLSPEKYEKLWSVLSINAYARWFAVMNLTASTHSDNFHNHLFYFDPTLGHLEPAVIDTNGHGMFHFHKGRRQIFQGYEPDPTIPLNEPREPLRDAALRDPRFYHLRNKVLFEALNTWASVESQHKLLDTTFKIIDPNVYADHRKKGCRPTFAGVSRIPYSNSQYEEEKKLLYDWIVGRDKYIRNHLQSIEVEATLASKGSDSILLLDVSGHASVDFDTVALDSIVLADTNFDGSFASNAEAKERLFPGLFEDSGETHRFVNVYRIPNHFLRPASQRYLFKIPDARPATVAKKLPGTLRNSITKTKAKVKLNIVDQINPSKVIYNSASLHVWKLPKSNNKNIVLGPGLVRLNEDLLISEKQKLEVRAGTQLLLGPGVSIVAKGKLEIQGTAKNPVSLYRKDTKRPWGSIVLLGAGANESKISYLVARGGSKGHAGYSFVSGMLASYGVEGLKISNTLLAENTLSDDLLHVVYGSFSITDSQLNDCYSDCIDIDYGQGDLSNLRIKNAGNDGIDFMTSTSSLNEIEIIKVGDKGLSIGEASQVDAKNIKISNASTGISIKDSSHLNLINSAIIDNQTGIAIFRKNWRYESPGQFKGHEIVFNDNDVSLSVEKDGKAELYGQGLPVRRHGEGLVVTYE